MNALGIVGVVFMGIGIVSIVAPDLTWSVQKWENSLRGRASERSDTWESGRVMRGIGIFVLGLLLLIAS